MIFKTLIVNGKKRTLIIKANSNEKADEKVLDKAVLAVMGEGFELKVKNELK